MGCGQSTNRDWPPFRQTLRDLMRYDLHKDPAKVVQVSPGPAIDCSLTDVLELCLSKFDAPEERGCLRQFAEVVGMLARFEIMVLASEVGHNYRVCAPTPIGQRKRDQLRAEGRGAEIDAIHMQFLEQMCHVLKGAAYCVVSQGEGAVSATESFMFELPVEVDWACHDDRVLGRFLALHPSLRAFTPSWADRVLLFRQGTSVATIRKPMLLRKLKRLLYLLFIKPPLQLARYLGGLRQRLRGVELMTPLSPTSRHSYDWDAPPPVAREVSTATLMRLGANAQQKLLTRHTSAAASPRPRPPVLSPTSGRRRHPSLWALASQVRPKRLKDRVGFLSAFPTVWSLLSGFFTAVTLREPTFRNVAILYCHSLAGERKATNDPHLQEEPEGIHIKLFRDIPLADMEVVFPFKRVALRKRHVIQSLVTVAAGVWSMYQKVVQGGWTAGVLQGLSAIVVARALSVVSGMRKAKTAMEREVHRTFVHKSLDTNEGALYYLLNCWERQEAKEMLLAYTYCTVLQDEEEEESSLTVGVDVADIQTVVEAELQDHLQVEVTFRAHRAIQKLEQHGVVRRWGGHLRPAPLDEAVASLRRRWDTHLRSCALAEFSTTPMLISPFFAQHTFKTPG